METPSEPRSERIDIRTTPTVKHLLQQAAHASHKHVSDFLLEHGVLAATGALADRRLFLLDNASWDQFIAALDRPLTARPNLKRLLTEPGQLD